MHMTNRHNYPQWYVDFVNAFGYDATQGGRRRNDVSATGMIKPLQITLLMERHGDKVVEDVADQTWRLLGSAAHEAAHQAQIRAYARRCEEAVANGLPKPPAPMMEERMYVPLITPNGTLVSSGQADRIDAEDGWAKDFKITSAWTMVYRSRDQEWNRQLSIYNWMADMYSPIEVANMGQICAILRDWDKKRVEPGGDYPERDVVFVDFELATPVHTGQWMHSRADEILKARKLGDDQLPQCTMDDVWASDERWAVYRKEGLKKASKLCKSEVEAQSALLGFQSGNPSAYIEYRPGTRRRCMDYCSVAPFCHQHTSYCEENGLVVPQPAILGDIIDEPLLVGA